MSDFINTIDIVGDDVLCGSIIDKSITEFKDDKITMVGDYVFHQCKNLKTVEIPSVTKLWQNAFRECSALESINLPSVIDTSDLSFYSCTSLKRAEFSMLVYFSGAEFLDCSSLETLILRMPTMSAMKKTGVLSGTAIANGTGYIYVPKALVDSYKSATNWTVYANQFRAIEDYPEICGG